MDLPRGIAEEFVKSSTTFAFRWFVVDNSGSMSQQDGHKMISSGGKTGMIQCSRWDEVGCSFKWLSKVAVELDAPTEFRLLNPTSNGSPQVVHIGDGSPKHDQLARVDAMISSSPSGRTPLCASINAVVAEMTQYRQQLLDSGKRAAVIIVSDGEASDGDVAAALRPLRDLPCWVVIRLCTDDDSVVNYWNGIDDELELDLDVLDDLQGEAKEITAHAPYLTYGLALHRLREFGTALKLIDVLDERKLSRNEALELVTLVFGAETKEQLPHPDLDWKGFLTRLDHLNKNFPVVWDPIHNKKRPWFDMRKLHKAFGGGACAIM